MEEAKTKITMDKSSLTKEMLDILQESAEEGGEGYDGEEYIGAAKMIAELDPPVVCDIPWCIYDIRLDEHGIAIPISRYDSGGLRIDLKDDGKTPDPEWEPRPRRFTRLDAAAILAWYPLKREDPDITIEDIKGMMRGGNLRDFIRKVFKFWDVDLEAMEDRARERLEEAEANGEDIEKPEAEDTGNFIDEP